MSETIYARTDADEVIVDKAITTLLTMYKSQSGFAKALGRKPQQVQAWFNKREIPLRWAYRIEKLTKGKVKCHQLCPGYFPVH